MPVVYVEPQVVGEGSGFIDVVVRLDSAWPSAISVNYAASRNEGGSSTDVVPVSGAALFQPGETSKTVRIQLVEDSVAEGLEGFTFNLSFPALVGPPDVKIAQRLTPFFIADNDRLQSNPDLTTRDVVVDEKAGTAAFVVRLGDLLDGGASSQPVTVTYATADGTARAGQDYAAVSGSLTFAPGENVKTVLVPVTDDSSNEGREHFELVLSGAVGARLVHTRARAEIGASDATAVAQPRISVDEAVVGEGDGYVDVVVRLSAPALAPVEANLGLTPVIDFVNTTTDAGGGVVAFAPGETTKVVRIGIGEDLGIHRIEPSLLTQLTATALFNTAATGLHRGTVAVVDNDTRVALPGLFVDDLVVDEQAGTATFVVRLGNYLGQSSANVVAVDFATRDGTATAGLDYTARSGRLEFAPGQSVRTVSVDLLDDSLAEGRERFELVLSNPSNATLGRAAAQAEIGLSDGVQASQPNVTADDISIDEHAGLVEMVVRLDAPSPNVVTMSASFDGGLQDFNGRGGGTLVFAPGETTKTLRFATYDDTAIEAPEFVLLGLLSPSNATLLRNVALAHIFDNDNVVQTPALFVSDVHLDESAGTANFAVQLGYRSGMASTQPVTVNFSTADLTATAGQDYLTRSGSLTFLPGESLKTVAVDLVDDALAERGERFNLVLSQAVNAIVADGLGQAHIGSNDAARVTQPRISVLDAVVSEVDGYVDLLVQLSAPASGPVDYFVSTIPVSAGFGADFKPLSIWPQTFAPGQTVQTVRLNLVQDRQPEATEHLNVTLQLGSGATATLGKATAVVTIIDDDTPVQTPAMYVSDAVVDERHGSVSFVVRLGQSQGAASNSTVSVDYGTRDATAVAGRDYLAQVGTLVFSPGEVAKTVTVDVIDDAWLEPLERFTLALSNPVNATLGDAVATAEIGASDAPEVARPVAGGRGVVVSEADGWVDVMLSLSAPSATALTLQLSAFGTTAGPADFQALHTSASFAPGETTSRFRLALLPDLGLETTETLRIALSPPAGATVTAAPIEVTLHDDDDLSRSVLSFGRSDDLYRPTSPADVIVEGAGGGNDTVRVAWNITLPEQIENAVLEGSASLNATGNAAMNLFVGNVANNTIDGRDGIDTAVFAATWAQATLSGSGGNFVVTSARDGSDTLISVERLQFADTVRAYDSVPGGNTYGAYAMLNAAFNAPPSTALLSEWTRQLDQLGNLRDLAQAMINSLAPGVSNETLVAHLWATIVETPLSERDLAHYVGLIQNGSFTQASLVEFVTTHPLNTDEIASIVGQPFALDPAWFVVPGT